jgi:hypothetical protein
MNVPARRTSTAAIISLVFGILSWTVLPVVGAIVAIVTGHVARGEIRRAPEAVEGNGLALAGLILGWANLLLIVIAALLFVLFFGGVAVLAAFAG